MFGKTTKTPVSNGWRKIRKTGEPEATLNAIAELDVLCFDYNDFQRMLQSTETYGDMYTLTDNGALIGYAIYGQLWLPKFTDAYISRIGVHPKHRQKSWGQRILNIILSDIASRRQHSVIWTDIRQSNIASQQLFHKAGFYPYCEFDGHFNGKIAIRVMRSV